MKMKTKVRILRPDMELNDATISFFYEKATFRSTMTAEIGEDIGGTVLQLVNTKMCDAFHEEMEAVLKEGDLLELMMVDDNDIVGKSMKSDDNYLQVMAVAEGAGLGGIMLGTIPKVKINLYEHVPTEVTIPFTLDDTEKAL